MSKSRVTSLVRPLAATLLVAGVSCAAAQGYPTKPIHFVVPFAAGGATDSYARVFGQKYAEAWGQPVIIDNRAGAGGNIAANSVAKAAPDGYTLLFTTVTQAVAPGLYAKLPYDPVKDLLPVTQLVSSALILVTNTQLPASSVSDLVALAKSQPGKLNFGSSGVGTGPHLVAEMFCSAARLKAVHVAYKGDAPLIPSLLSNEVQFAFLPPPAALPHIKAGRLRPLAVTGGSRSSSLPDLPTLREAGLTGFEVSSWVGLFTTGGAPRDIANKFSLEAMKILRTPELVRQMAVWGVEPEGTSPEVFATRYRADIEKFANIIREAHIPLAN